MCSLTLDGESNSEAEHFVVLIILGSSKICGPIFICDHATIDLQHHWPHTHIGNISGFRCQGYKPFIKLIQDMMHAGYNVETTYQV